MIEIKKKDGYEDELKFSNMMKSEYIIASKRFDEPKTGTGTNKDGSFEWVLYGLLVHEIKRFDDEKETYVVEKFDPAVEMTTFKGAKSFREKIDKLSIGQQFKLTQVPVENQAYKAFVLEPTGVNVPVSSEPVSPPQSESQPTLSAKIGELKAAGVPVGEIFGLVKDKYETTEQAVAAIYGAL